MAFPTHASPITTGSDSATATTRSVTLPTFSAGDRIIVIANVRDAGTASISTAGWTQLENLTDQATASMRFIAYYRDMQAGDASTITLINAVSAKAAWALIKFSAGTFDSGVGPYHANATGSSATPDPPNVAPGAGALDFTWIAAFGQLQQSSTISVYPLTGDNTLVSTSGGSGTTGCHVGFCDQDINASSENPGTFTSSLSGHWVALTIGVAPAAAGGTTTVTVDVPGAVTWTGSAITLVTSIQPTAGAVVWTGSSVGLTTKIQPTAGAIQWAGSTVGLTTSIAPTAGAVTWNGQTLGLASTIGQTAGNVTWSGATDIILTGLGGTIVQVTVPGAISWTGQSVSLTLKLQPTAGGVTWTGSALGLKISIQTVPGAIVWTGSTVATVRGIVPIAGSVTWAGQILPLKFSVGISAGQIIWAGATLDLHDSGSLVGMGVPVLDPQAVLTGTEGQGFTTGLEGKAQQTGTEGQAFTTGTDGKAVLQGG
jgi:hypothetical protein